jgi:hypothetical protein
MALKNAPVVLGTADQTLVTMAAGSEGAVHGLVLVNNTGSAANVTLKLYNQALGTTITVASAYPVAANTPFAWPKPIDLSAGDQLIASCATASAVVALVSIATQTGTNPIATALNPRGAWSSAATYAPNDLVSLSGASYIAITTNTNSSPPSVNWMLLAAQGTAGSSGATTVASTAAQIWASSDNTTMATPAALAAAQVFQTVTNATTAVVNFNAGINFKWTRTANSTLGTPLNFKEGWAGTIRLDGTGTLAFTSEWDITNGTPTATAVAGNYDYLDYQIVNAAGGAKSIRGDFRKYQ